MGLSDIQRTLKFVKYLPKFNWEPTLLTSHVSKYYAHDYSLLEDFDQDKTKIIRVKGRESFTPFRKKGTVILPNDNIRKIINTVKNFIYIPDDKKGWAKRAFQKASEVLNNEHYDLIFATAPPFSSLTLASKLSEQFSIPLVLDYRTLWYGNQFAVYPTYIHKLILKKYEYNALKRADKIIVANRRIKERLMDFYKFIDHNDIVIIPQGFDPEDTEKLAFQSDPKSKMKIIYSGIFFDTVTPKFFLDAFKLLSQERPDIASNIELHFVGLLQADHKAYIKKLRIQNFIVDHGFIEHQEALKKVSDSNVVWITAGKGRNADTFSSSKLFEFAGLKKPILALLPDGSLKNYATEYGASFIIDPEDINAIKNAILNIYELFRKNELPAPDKQFVDQFRYDVLTDKLTKEFQFIMKDRVV